MTAQPKPEPFLALLSESDREALLAIGRLRRFNPGEHLTRIGQRSPVAETSHPGPCIVTMFRELLEKPHCRYGGTVTL